MTDGDEPTDELAIEFLSTLTMEQIIEEIQRRTDAFVFSAYVRLSEGAFRNIANWAGAGPTTLGLASRLVRMLDNEMDMDDAIADEEP